MKIYSKIDDPALIEAIKNGEVGVIRTDTVYGIVCDAHNKASVKRLYSLKNRTDKPGTIIAATLEQIEDLGFAITDRGLMEKYWPGPYSFELHNTGSFRYLSLGSSHQAVRIPGDSFLLKLLKATGPMQTTSANQPGEPTSKNIAEAKNIFGNNVDFYVDGGEVINNTPSKIVRIVNGDIEFIRK